MGHTGLTELLRATHLSIQTCRFVCQMLLVGGVPQTPGIPDLLPDFRRSPAASGGPRNRIRGSLIGHNPVCPNIGQTESSGSPPDAARRSRDAGIRITPRGGNVQRHYMRKVIHHRQQRKQNEQAQYPRHRQRAGSDPCERDSDRAFRQPICAATHDAPISSPSHTR